MLANWNPDLEQRVRAIDATARIMVHGRIEQAADLRQRFDQWQQLDSLPTNVELVANGGVRLKPTAAAGPQSTIVTSGSTYYRSFQDVGYTGPFIDPLSPDVHLVGPGNSGEACVLVKWAGNESSQMELTQVQAWLAPQFDLTHPLSVKNWVCQLYAVTGWTQVGADVAYEFLPIGRVTTPAQGQAAGFVVFDFSTLVNRPQPKQYLFVGPDGIPICYMFAVFNGLTATGGASNIGLGYDSGHAGVVSAAGSSMQGNLLYWFPNASGPTSPQFFIDGGPTNTVPAVKMILASYTAATVTFSTHPLDLGSAQPKESIELVAQVDAPVGTSIVTEVKDDGGIWRGFTDGEILSQVTGFANATYQTLAVRATLNPNSAQDHTPLLLTLGARAVATVDLSDVAEVESVAWALDVTDLHAEVPQLRLRAIHDGERDFHDRVSQLLSAQGIGKIYLRLYVGDLRLPRRQWIHPDDFLVDDYDLDGPAAFITGVSPLALLRGALPVATPEVDAYPTTGESNPGSWTASAAIPAGSLYTMIADGDGAGSGLLPWNDSTYIETPNNPSGAIFTAPLQGIGTPNQLAGVQLQYRYQLSPSSTSISMTISLFEGSTAKASQTITIKDTTVLAGFFNLTAAQISSIVNWGNVSVQFKATGTGKARITWARLAVLSSINPLQYSIQSPKAVTQDLIHSQIALDARYQGADMSGIPGLDETLGPTLTLSKQISAPTGASGDIGRAKAELDAIAFLAGGFWGSEAGAVTFRSLFDVLVYGDGTVTFSPSLGAPVASIPISELAEPIRISPGLRYRVPQYKVPWGWSDSAAKYSGQAFGESGPGLETFGLAHVDPVQTTGDTAAQWIPDQGLANGVALRHVQALGLGMLNWRFRTQWRHPELTLGDVVNVQTDRFLGFDPTGSGRAIFGPVWVTGFVVGKFDIWGSDLAVWVPNYAAIVGGSSGGVTPPPEPPPTTPVTDLTVPQSPIHGCVAVVGDASDPGVVQLINPGNSNVYTVVYELKRAQSGESSSQREVFEYLVGPLVVTGGSLVTGFLERRDQRDLTAIKSSLIGYTAAGTFADLLGFYGGLSRAPGNPMYAGLAEWSPLRPDQFPIILPPGTSLLARTAANAATLVVAACFDEIPVTSTDLLPASDPLTLLNDFRIPRCSCHGWVVSIGSVSSGPWCQILNPLASGRLMFIHDLRVDASVPLDGIPIFGYRVINAFPLASSGTGFSGGTVLNGTVQRRDGRSLRGSTALMQATNLYALQPGSILQWTEKATQGAPETYVVWPDSSFPLVLLPGQAMLFNLGTTAGVTLKLSASWDEFETTDPLQLFGGPVQ